MKTLRKKMRGGGRREVRLGTRGGGGGGVDSELVEAGRAEDSVMVLVEVVGVAVVAGVAADTVGLVAKLLRWTVDLR